MNRLGVSRPVEKRIIVTPETPDLVDMLAVVDMGARTHYDVFTGPTLPTPHGRTFGGQVLGQSLAAAGQTVSSERFLHSMHGYFMRPGDSKLKMTFEVARLYDGSSFSTRRVQAYQNGEVLMSCIASYQDEDPSQEHQTKFDMSTMPDPESLPSIWEKYGALAGQSGANWMLNRPFDFRHVEGDIVLEVPNKETLQHVWLRTIDHMPDSNILHTSALAFASDYLIMEPVMRRHGVPWATPGMKGASLDHAMWFHRPFRVDEWLLYVLDSPTSQNNRGLTHGAFYDREGNLVASVSQETMARFPAV